MRVDGIPEMGRNTQGVRLMETDPDEVVMSVTRLTPDED
jgi:DNA gyrase/topoisomerase IV subunit A